MEKHKPFLLLIHALLDSRPDPGQAHPCPTCGGKLEVTFAGYVRGQKTMVGVTAECRRCDVLLHVDCAPAPSWVAMGDTEASRRYFSVWLQRDHPSPGEP